MATKLAELATLEDGKGHCAKAEGLSVMLIRAGDAVHAIENRCPHLGLPFGRGRIADGAITCPFHGSRFDIATGENLDWVSAIAGMKIPIWSRALLSFGKKPQPVRTFPVSIRNGAIYVDL